MSLRNLGSVMSDLRAKAQEAGSALQDAQRRISQQALEAAGVAEKTELAEDVPELQTHAKLEAALRKLFSLTEKYMRAINAMSEASLALADEFTGLFEEPSMHAVAQQLRQVNRQSTPEQLKKFGQVLHRKVFQPVRREIEGRKEFERRLADRKKVRLDYDAYRRKQMGLISSDPANKKEYEANLEQAAATFKRHSESVMRDVTVVNTARQQTLSAAFMGFVAAQFEFWNAGSTGLQQVVEGAKAGADAQGWRAMHEEVLSLGKQASPAEVQSPPQQTTPPQQQPAAYKPPQPAQVQSQPSGATPAVTPAARPMRRASAPSQPTAHDPFNMFGDGPPPSASPPAATNGAEPDLLGGMAMGSCAPPPAARPPPVEPQVDFLNGFNAAPGSSAAATDLMGGGGGATDLMGGSDVDDLFGLAAPPALVPTAMSPGMTRSQSTTSPRPQLNRGMASQSVPDELSMFMGMGVSGAGGGAGGANGLSGGDLLGGCMGGDLMGDMMGGGMGGSAPQRARPARAQTMAAMPTGPPGTLPDRAALIAQREAAKQAAIAEKVNDLRAKEASAAQDRETERDLEKVIKLRVQQWQNDKKNLRALLASLHEIAPPCQWKPMSLAELLDAAAVKRAYKKALLAVHPDKQPPEDLEKKVLAQHIFDGLRDAWKRFEQTG